jgi:hypothetical protein
MAMAVFLGLSGYEPDAAEEDVVIVMLQLAEGRISAGRSHPSVGAAVSFGNLSPARNITPASP